MLVFVGVAAWDTILKVKRIPGAGGEAGGTVLAEGPGGKAVNSAAYAARHGAHVRLLSAVGPDHAGRQLRAACAQLPEFDARFSVAQATRTAMVMIAPGGERTIVHFMPGGAPPNLPHPGSFNAEAFAGASLTWIDQQDKARRARFRAKADGLLGLPVQHLHEEADARVNWDFAVGSADDVAHVDDDMLLDAGLRFCVLTHGARRVRFWQRGRGWQEIAVDPVPDHELKDTCGAGDAFLGGLLAGLDQGLHLPAAVKAGCRAGADAVRHHGSWPVALDT